MPAPFSPSSSGVIVLPRIFQDRLMPWRCWVLSVQARDLDIHAWQAYTKCNNRIAVTPSLPVAPGGGGPTRTIHLVRGVNR
jgi:hypothetical protein